MKRPRTKYARKSNNKTELNLKYNKHSPHISSATYIIRLSKKSTTTNITNMDVWGVFVGDSTLSYGGSMRNNYYRDYEQFPYGTLEHASSASAYPAKDSYSRVQGNLNNK